MSEELKRHAGFAEALKSKLVVNDKGVLRRGAAARPEVDLVRDSLRAIRDGAAVPEETVAMLKKRKLVEIRTVKSFRLDRGAKFAAERKKLVTDLTAEMIASGSWRSEEFKPLNLKALGRIERGGHLHPLLKVRAGYRQVLLEMGFEEMATNAFVESSFWNFDALFQPQQHPARDSHDTFFIRDPPALAADPALVQRVGKMHSEGDHESTGWRYAWSAEEAAKTVLRTHTTAVSSRMLYRMAQEGFRPRRFFSIDKVFRNEAIDATHLAEFNQIEGMVCDRGLGLADLMGVVKTFFAKIGLEGLRFKPAYNPYTEPSMEIFAFHPILKKWVEVGNSGVFRKEMLRPLGLPEDVSVIAWGLGLERPACITYGIREIRALVGHKVDLDFVVETPVFSLALPTN
jgi:phenylalanyl-tRNA synthetase alpha chain